MIRRSALAYLKNQLLEYVPAQSDPTPEPVFTSVSPSHGLASESTQVILHGKWLTDLRRVDLIYGESSDWAQWEVLGDTRVQITIPPGLPGRFWDIRITTGTGVVTLGDAFTYDGTSFRPEQTDLSAYWSARVNSYTGSPAPWPGVASLGISGVTGALGSGPFPSVGSPLNGHVPPRYVAADSPNLTNPTDITTVVHTTGGTIFGLFKAASALPPAVGGAFDDPAFFTDGNFDVGVVLNSSGVKAYGYSSGYRETLEIAAAPGAWHMFVACWDGVNLTCYVDAEVPATVACPALTIMTGQLLTGRGHASTYLDVDMPELGTALFPWSAGDVNNFRLYLNSVYGLSL